MDEDECTYVFECQSLFRAKILCQETHLLSCVYCFSVTNILENVVDNVGEIVADNRSNWTFRLLFELSHVKSQQPYNYLCNAVIKGGLSHSTPNSLCVVTDGCTCGNVRVCLNQGLVLRDSSLLCSLFQCYLATFWKMLWVMRVKDKLDISPV